MPRGLPSLEMGLFALSSAPGQLRPSPQIPSSNSLQIEANMFSQIVNAFWGERVRDASMLLYLTPAAHFFQESELSLS